MDQLGPVFEGRLQSLLLLSVAEVLAMSVWFSASAVTPQLTQAWSLSSGEAAWLAMSLQGGFVCGAVTSAMLSLPDRFRTPTVFLVGAAGAALFNASIILADSYVPALVARFGTGAMLAGVYPPGMKLVATWTKEDRGLWIGILVGALTLGSASPHLVNVFSFGGNAGMPPWEAIIGVASILAILSGLIVAAGVREGPFVTRGTEFYWKDALRTIVDRPVRLANFGYFGHMWELYAVWVWVPILLVEVYEDAGLPIRAARLAGFAVVGAGFFGSILAGLVADRRGRTKTTITSLAISGSCCLIAGCLIGDPVILTVVCLIWGSAVVADSAQFSVAVSELSRPEYVGTALTLQTSLGFLLTMVSIRIVPTIVDVWGWGPALGMLAIGPVAGVWSMAALRKLPESSRMASGNR